MEDGGQTDGCNLDPIVSLHLGGLDKNNIIYHNKKVKKLSTLIKLSLCSKGICYNCKYMYHDGNGPLRSRFLVVTVVAIIAEI